MLQSSMQEHVDVSAATTEGNSFASTWTQHRQATCKLVSLSWLLVFAHSLADYFPAGWDCGS